MRAGSESIIRESRNYGLRRKWIANAVSAAATVALGGALKTAQASTIYWNGLDSNDATNGWTSVNSWSTSATATTPPPSAVPGASDTAVFSISGVTTDPQIVDLNANQSAAGLVFLGTDTGGVTIQNGTGTDTLSVGTGGITLNSGTGAVNISSGLAFATAGTSNVSGSGGTLTATGAFAVGNATTSSAVTVNMSGLTNFNYSNSAGTFTVGSTGTTTSTSLTLATNSTITAGTLIVGPNGAANGPDNATLTFEQNTTINASTIALSQQKYQANVAFASGLTSPTLTMQGTGGAGTFAAMTLGSLNNTSATTYTNTFNSSAGTLSAYLSSLTIGNANSTAASGRQSVDNSTFTVGAGTVEITGTMDLGQVSGTAGSSIEEGIGTFAMNGATVYVKTIKLGDAASAETGTGSTATGTFNLASGTLNAALIENGGTLGTASRTFTWSAGTIGNLAGDITATGLGAQNLVVSGPSTASPLAITLAGTGVHNLTASSGQSITFNSTAILAGPSTSTLTINGAGNVVLNGASTFAGSINLASGTLTAGNTAGSATGTGSVTLNGGTLASGAVGTISGSVLAGSAAHTISPGGVGTIGTLTVGGLTTSNLTTISFDLGTGSGDVANGDLLGLGSATPTIASGTAIAFNTSTTVLGNSYRLISGTNTSTVPLGNFTLPDAPAGQYYQLSTLVDANYIDLTVTGGPANNLTWNDNGGSPADGISWDTTQQNWNNGTSATTFSSLNEDNVTFNDVNNGNYNVTIASGLTVTPGSTTVTTANTYNFSGGGSIGGTGGLLVNGTGTLNLATANTFTGNTNVASGTLNLQSSLALQDSTLVSGNVTFDASVTSNAFTLAGLTGSGNIALQNNAATPAAIVLTVNNSATDVYSGALSGPGSLIKSGSGTLTISGSNSYTGGTVVTTGTVNVSGNQSGATGGWLIGIGSNTTSTVNFSAGSVIVSTGLIQIGNTSPSGFMTETLNVAGTVTQSGTLLAGRFGVINISSGGIWNQSGPASVTAPSGSGYSGGPLNVAGGVFNYTGTNAFGINPAVANSGSATVASGTFNTSQGFANNIASTTTGSAILQLTNGGVLALTADVPQLTTTAGSPFVVNLGNGSGGVINTGSFNTSIAATVQNVSGQTGALTKLGTGSLTLTGTNSYSGLTNINGGTLLAGSSGALGTSGVALGNAATSTPASLLTAGAFNISNAIVVGGSSTGTLTIGGNTDNNSAFTGPIILDQGVTITQVANTGTNALSITGGIAGNASVSGTVTFAGPGNIVVATNPISDASTAKTAVAVTGGFTTFMSSNNYSGGTTITAGTLLAGATNTLSPDSVITINGGTLDASAYANSIAGLIVGASGTLNLGLGNVLTTTGTASLAGTLNLTGTPGTLPEELMAYSSETGMFSTANIPAGYQLLYMPSELDLAVVSSGAANLTWNDAGGFPADGVTWDINNNQNFNNGTSAAVYHEGDNVTFNDNNNSPANPNAYSVTLNTTVHPTSVTVSTANAYTITGTGGIADVVGGTTPLSVTGTGSLTLGGSNTFTGGTTVGTGTDTAKLILSGPTAFPVATALTINSGASVQIAAHTGGSGNVVVVQTSTLSNSGLIDVTNNDLTVKAAPMSLATISAEAKAGFAGGTWQGSTGITSTLAAADSTHLTAVGVIQNDESANGGLTALIYGSGTTMGLFDGTNPALDDILVKYTYYGDTNLDGAVDGSDYTNIDNGFTHGLTGWQNGDFNYDRVVDGSDYTLIDNAFNTQGSSLGTNPSALIASATAQISGGSSAVPEPTTLGLLGLGAIGLLNRRRRRN